MVADSHLQTVESLLEQLTKKLYARNPRELKKQPTYLLENRLNILHGANRHNQTYDELNNLRGTDAIQLALDKRFQGDRVFALMAGLTSMILESYNNQEEFFINDSLDEQKLYNSARNIEILLWKLRQQSLADETLLLTNATGDEVNLSFERLFGKLIATQDMIAHLVAQRNQRTIRTAVHTAGRLVFLPI